MCNVQTASLDELQASLWSSRHSDWEDTFRVNVTAHYFLSVALLKLLASASDLDLPDGRKGRDEGRGVVVITSSCASMHNCTNVDLVSKIFHIAYPIIYVNITYNSSLLDKLCRK